MKANPLKSNGSGAKKKSRSTLESAGHIAALAAKQAESGMGLLKRTFVRNDANKYGSSNFDKLTRGGGYSQPSEKAKANEPKRIAKKAVGLPTGPSKPKVTKAIGKGSKAIGKSGKASTSKALRNSASRRLQK